MADLEWKLQNKGNAHHPPRRGNHGNGHGQAQGGGGNQGQPASTKWLCLCCDCEWSAAGNFNNGSRTHCLGCQRPKHVCKTPPKEIGCRDGARHWGNVVQAPKDNEAKAKEAARLERVANRKQKKQDRRAQKREARTPADDPVKAAEMDVEPAKEQEKQADPDKKLVLPKSPCLKEYMAARFKPPESVEVKSAEQCLLEVAPKDKAVELARARGDKEYVAKALEEAKKGEPGSMQLAAAKDLEKKLEEADKLVEKLSANVPATACTISLLKKTISNHEHSSTERVQSWKASATRRQAAKDKVLTSLDEHIKELQAHRAAVAEECDLRQVAWDTHNGKVQIVMSKVAAVLVERLKGAKVEAGVVETVEEVAAVEKAPSPPVEAPVATQQELDYYRTVPWSPDELPKQIPEAKNGEHVFWLRLAQNVQEWSHAHGCQPCTFAELLSDSTGPPQSAEHLTAQMESMANLVGLDYWRKLYGERIVKAGDVVPHHLGFVLYQAMNMPRVAAEKALGEATVKEGMKQAKATIKAALAEAKARPKVGRFVKTAGK